MKTFIFILLAGTFAVAQPKSSFSVKEFTGTVVSIRPGFGFALTGIEMRMGEDIRNFGIGPAYGKSILSKIKVGQTVTLKADVNNYSRDQWLKVKKERGTDFGFILWEGVTEIKMDGVWIPIDLPERKFSTWATNWSIFLEKKVISDYFLDGQRKGLVFENGLIAFSIFSIPRYRPMADALPGTTVSFIGNQSPVKDEYLFPIDGVKEVYSYVPLTKIEGTIDAFIHKQNFARIGLTLGGKKFSFPTEYATKVERMANGEKVTLYFEGSEDERTHLLPSVHAIIQNRDTILIPTMFYGAPDGNHEHIPVELDGKISKVNRSEKGKVISLIMGNDCYVEVDAKMVDQLGTYLSKGKQIKIIGEERVKKDGEIYERNYRIVTPTKVVADGKEFILKK
jgi:hypothetical protein